MGCVKSNERTDFGGDVFHRADPGFKEIIWPLRNVYEFCWYVDEYWWKSFRRLQAADVVAQPNSGRINRKTAGKVLWSAEEDVENNFSV